jgi:hypothetical protein
VHGSAFSLCWRRNQRADISKCVGGNCGLAKRPDRLTRLPELPPLAGAEAVYHAGR